jgi:hypothetical protein
MVGVIHDVFDEGSIVDFSRPHGTTIAGFVVNPECFEPALEVLTASSDRSKD